MGYRLIQLKLIDYKVLFTFNLTSYVLSIYEQGRSRDTFHARSKGEVVWRGGLDFYLARSSGKFWVKLVLCESFIAKKTQNCSNA